MVFSEMFGGKINSMIYDRCFFNVQGKTRPEIAKYTLSLLSNTTKQRYDIYMLESNILPYDKVNVPEVAGEKIFDLTEEVYHSLEKQFFFFEVTSNGIILTPNFAFEKYEECGRFIMGYTKDTRMLDVMFKKLTADEASKMQPQPASPIAQTAPKKEEAQAEVKVEVKEETVEETVVANEEAKEEKVEKEASVASEEMLVEEENSQEVASEDIVVEEEKQETVVEEVNSEEVKETTAEEVVSEEVPETLKEEVKEAAEEEVPNGETHETASEKIAEQEGVETHSEEVASEQAHETVHEEVETEKEEPVVAAKADEKPEQAPPMEATHEEQHSALHPIPLLVYDRFCMDYSSIAKKDLIKFMYTFVSPVTNQVYETSVIKSSHKKYADIVIPEKDGKPVVVIDKISYQKFTMPEFFFVEVVSNGQIQVPNMRFENLEKAKKYLYNYTMDTRPLDVMFKKITKEDAEKLDKQPTIKIKEEKTNKIGAITPPVNMSIYSRFCTLAVDSNKDEYMEYQRALKLLDADRYYVLSVIRSANKKFEDIQIPEVKGKKLFELPHEDYEKLIRLDFFYIEATYEGKTFSLNKIFKDVESCKNYIDLYHADIRELEVMFKNMTPKDAVEHGAVKAVDCDIEEPVVEEKIKKPQVKDEKVDFIEVENSEQDSKKVQVSKSEDELFESDNKNIETVNNPDDNNQKSEDKKEVKEEHRSNQKTKITNADGSTTIYADKVIIQVGSGGLSYDTMGSSKYDDYDYGRNDYSLDDILGESDTDISFGSSKNSSADDDFLSSILGDIEGDMSLGGNSYETDEADDLLAMLGVDADMDYSHDDEDEMDDLTKLLGL